MSSTTSVQVWTVEELVRASHAHGDADKKRHIDIPKFQRSVVWSSTQKQRLVDTLVNGMPVGAILLYEHGKSDRLEDGQISFTKYILIDGLQRCTALREHFASPTKAFSSDKLPNDFLDVLAREFALANISDIKGYISDWIRSLSGWDLTSNYDATGLLKYLVPRVNSALTEGETNALVISLSSRLNSHLDVIKKKYDISQRQIPVIVYSGSSKELPTIFERLNHSGTQLNKYQIFAASWQAHSIEARDPEIETRVISKYRSLIDEGYEIENFDANATTLTPLNYYEYLFGFGKTLSDKFPRLFRDKARDADDVESIGFNLTGLCVDCNLKQLGTLPEVAKKEELPSLRKAIEEASAVVDELLRPVLALKANSRGNTLERVKFHTEFQVCAYVAAIFKSEFHLVETNGNRKWESRRVHTNSRVLLKTALLARFISESVQNFWSGTGDEKAMAAVENSSAYASIKRAELEASLNQWVIRDLERRDKTRRLPPESELILRAYYAKRWNAFDHLNADRFDLEHLIPVERLRAYMGGEMERGRPINALGNLCLLTQGPNRSKKESTYFEWLDEQLASGQIDGLRHQQMATDFETQALVTREEIEIVINAGANGARDMFWDAFVAFANARAERLTTIVARDYIGN